MAFSTYSELKASLGTYCYNRTDLPTSDLVTQAEARLRKELKVRFKEADAALTATSGSRFIDLPSGFIDASACWLELDWGRKALDRLIPEIPVRDGSGEPDHWAIDGERLAFERACGSAYSVTLRCRRTWSLSDEEPTNWLLTNHPDVYLAACLVEAGLWMQDEGLTTLWNARYEAARDALNQIEGEANRAPLRTELAYAMGADCTEPETFLNG